MSFFLSLYFILIGWEFEFVHCLLPFLAQCLKLCPLFNWRFILGRSVKHLNSADTEIFTKNVLN